MQPTRLPLQPVVARVSRANLSLYDYINRQALPESLPTAVMARVPRARPADTAAFTDRVRAISHGVKKISKMFFTSLVSA
jgi:hypothetical protein